MTGAEYICNFQSYITPFYSSYIFWLLHTLIFSFFYFIVIRKPQSLKIKIITHKLRYMSKGICSVLVIRWNQPLI